MVLAAFPTMEVRWFYPGSIPEQVLDWFQQGEQQPQKQPVRVDYYLQLVDGQESIGIKLREGKIEIKQRYHRRRPVQLHERAVGAVELWRKWSFGLAEAESLVTVTDRLGSAWIGVQKERQVRTYRRQGDNVAAVSAGAEVGPSCDLELASLTVEGAEWWSLCFEACGEEATLQESLLLVAKEILASGNPPTLEVEASYSYPRWLQDRENR